MSKTLSYNHIHLPIKSLADKKPCDFDSSDVEGALKKIYSGQINPDVCLNVTAIDNFKEAVEMALMWHVNTVGNDRFVIVTEEKRKERLQVSDYVAIFTTLYKAVEAGGVTNDKAQTIVTQQIALRKSSLYEYSVNTNIRRLSIFREEFKPKGTFLKVAKKMTLNTETILELHGDLLPQNFKITEQQMYDYRQAYKKMLETIDFSSGVPQAA